jgi:hypothetical protein
MSAALLLLLVKAAYVEQLWRVLIAAAKMMLGAVLKSSGFIPACS